MLAPQCRTAGPGEARQINTQDEGRGVWATDAAREIEQELCSRHLPELLGDRSEFVLPDYDRRSLANIPATLARILGQEIPGLGPSLPPVYWEPLGGGVRRIVLVLLDALGYLQFRRLLREEPTSVWAGLADRGLLLPLTSVYPSTTATALASLMTGMQPIAHGLLGYELWLREYGVLAQMLSVQPAYGAGRETLLDWGLVPETFLPVPGLGTLLAQSGVESYGYLPAALTQSALTRMLYRGFGHLVGYEDVQDLWAKVSKGLAQDDAPLGFHWVYWGGIDAAIHKHGDADGPDGWVAQYQTVTDAFRRQFLPRLTPREREGTLLILCADHGFVDTPVEYAHDTDRDPVMRRELMAPRSGEARAAFLHCLRGDADGAREAIQESLGDAYLVRATQDVVAAGLFGHAQPAPESLARLGHLHVFCRSRHYLDRQDRRLVLRGRHGGLAPEEMLIPWLAVRLDGPGMPRGCIPA
jgi:hypothetical protein